ncbi:MAG: hypothetical protein Q8P18_11465 [Pseudomonadota bacterium]|nr:hypothetical protein [Pseudomonadota bacterium]
MLLFLLLAGCTDGDAAPDCVSDDASTEEPTCSCGPATVLIGGGADSFEPVEDGDDAIIVHGPQGGWHLLGSVRVENLSEYLTIHYWIEAPELGATVSDNTYRVVRKADGPCAGTYAGMFGYLSITALASGEADTPPEVLEGKELVLHMDVTDLDGVAASDELRVRGVRDAMDIAGLDDTGDPGDSGDTAAASE